MKENRKEVEIVTCCPFCGHANFIAVNEMDYLDWDDGELTQVAFPYLSVYEREALINGICEKCIKEKFPREEDEEFF